MRASKINGLMVSMTEQCVGNLPSITCIGSGNPGKAAVVTDTSGELFRLATDIIPGVLANAPGASVMGFSADTQDQRQVQIGFLVEPAAWNNGFEIAHDATGVKVYLIVLAISFDVLGSMQVTGSAAGTPFDSAWLEANDVHHTDRLLVAQVGTIDAGTDLSMTATLTLASNTMTVSTTVARLPEPEPEPNPIPEP